MPSEKVASLSTFSEGLMGISFAIGSVELVGRRICRGVGGTGGVGEI